MLRRAFKASACLYRTAFILAVPMMAQAKMPVKTVKTAKIHDSQLEEPVARSTPSLEQLQELKQSLTLEAAISIAEKNYPSLCTSAAKIATALGYVSLAKATYLPGPDFSWETNQASGQEEVFWTKKVFFKKQWGKTSTQMPRQGTIDRETNQEANLHLQRSNHSFSNRLSNAA